ncbi:sigma-70 family RNA polymerase sigma factor [Candidatus Peregrinibacteria bacterium]|nr:sigma-70 family RNA polymerase sigma factor [Candidatus Peregrinibacteria bacterium]
MDYSTRFTAELLQKAKDGDQEAFGEIFDVLLEPIYRYILFHVGDPRISEQITEEFFLRLWKDLRKFRQNGKGNFQIWAFQLCYKIVLGHASPDKNIQKSSLGETAEASSPAQAQDFQLQRALLELPDSQAEAIILKYFCSLSPAEVGGILEKTEGAVRILQSRGLKKLREILEGVKPKEDNSEEDENII